MSRTAKQIRMIVSCNSWDGQDCETESLTLLEPSVKEIEAVLKDQGWRRVGKYDLCPHCVKQVKVVLE